MTTGTVPDLRTGDEKVHLTSAMAEAFDSSIVSVLSRGSAKVYTASLWWSLFESAPDDAS